MAKIKVYQSQQYNVITDQMITTPSKRTREAILKISGTPLENTEQEVDESELDRHGKYLGQF